MNALLVFESRWRFVVACAICLSLTVLVWRRWLHCAAKGQEGVKSWRQAGLAWLDLTPVPRLSRVDVG